MQACILASTLMGVMALDRRASFGKIHKKILKFECFLRKRFPTLRHALQLHDSAYNYTKICPHTSTNFHKEMCAYNYTKRWTTSAAVEGTTMTVARVSALGAHESMRSMPYHA